MLQQLNFNHLYYFYVIATENSLSEATKILNVSQPTLSQQLRQFEESLGHSLFNRSGRSLKLNQYGEYLLGYSKDIFSKAETMITGFAYQTHIQAENHTSIGVTSDLSRSYASKLLNPLFVDPKINVKVDEGDIYDLIDRLQSGEIDFVLTETPSDHVLNKNLEVYNIKKSRNYFICGNNSKKRFNNIPEDFNDAPYFKYSSSYDIQKKVDRFFFTNNITPSVVGESNDMNIILSATEVNHCFAVAPDTVIHDLVKDKKLHILGEFDSGQTNVCAIYLKEQNSMRVKDILNNIKSQYS